jgi:pimeloyl-ACP methyl ester carboxylesterase
VHILEPETPLSRDYDAATRADVEFAEHFTHHFTTVDAVQMHYVVGGNGPQPIVLLHGFPETWFSWRAIMKGLLPGHTVIAVDLPGLGDSTGEIPAHDKASLARYVHLLLDRLGYSEGVQLAAHDFGGGIALALVTRWRRQFSRFLLMDFPVTGGTLGYEQSSFSDSAPTPATPAGVALEYSCPAASHDAANRQSIGHP